MKKVLFGFVTIVIVMSFATAAHAYYSGSTYVGGQYRYFYYDYSGSTSGKPLVIMLHGATGSGTEFFTPVHNPGGGVKNYCEKMKKFFVDNGYVVVAPSSRTNVNPPSSGPTQPYEFDLRIRWEHETASYASNEDLQLINYLKGTWASQRGINTSQVFVWGNSSGGFMAGRCAQYFGTGLKGVIIIDAGDPSQFVLDNDCIIENSDFLDNNNITFAANHSPVLSITNQYSDVWTNGPYGTVEILRKEVNLNYAQKMIGNVADSTNWVIPCDVSALGESNHAWTSWGDNYYDEMLSWMTDRINGNNDSKTVYWEGWSNLFSDANVWFSPSGSLPAPDSNDWARVTGNLCIIKGVANPGYLVVGWTDRYGNDEHGSIRQQKFAGSSKDSLCVVEESLSLGACADVSKNGLYYLENGSLQVLGTTYASYFGQTSYGHFFQYAGTSAYFRDVRMGGGTNAQGYTNHEGGTFQCRYLYVGDHAGSVLNGYRIWDGTLHVEYDMNNGYKRQGIQFPIWRHGKRKQPGLHGPQRKLARNMDDERWFVQYRLSPRRRIRRRHLRPERRRGRRRLYALYRAVCRFERLLPVHLRQSVRRRP